MLALILSTVDLNEKQRVNFEVLYYKYRNLLFSIAKEIVNSDTDCEDILQNTFIKIAQNLDKIGDINSRETKAFLVVILKSCTFDFLRREKRHKETLLYDDLPEIGDNDLEIERLTSSISYFEVCKAIKAIPSPYTEVLYLHFVCDYSVKKTAELLDRRTSTVKTQLVRGKKALQKNLREAEYEFTKDT